MKALPISKYYERISPIYLFYKITPIKSLRNYNSDKIAMVVSNLYKSISRRIEKENKKYFFTSKMKATYYIYIEKQKIEFYFIIPQEFKTLFLDKIKDCWKGITCEIVTEVPFFDDDCTKFCLKYKKEDAFSLQTDCRNNFLLSSMLNVVTVMDNGDRCGIVFNFLASDNTKNWKYKYESIIEKFRNNYPVDKSPNAVFILKLLGKFIYYLFDIVVEQVMNILGEPKSQIKIEKNNQILDSATTKKKNATIIDTQILVLSQSENNQRAIQNGISICQSFDTLNNDNELDYKIIKPTTKISLTDSKFKKVNTMITSTDECQNFISLAGRELIEEFGIDCIEALECQVPEKLQQGYICIGTNIYRGNQIQAYLRDNYNQGNYPLTLIGEQGSGKSKFIANYVKNILSRNEGCILIDFIKSCELSDDIIKVIPKDKLIILDMSDIKNIQGIGYNEMQPNSESDFDIMDCANKKTLYIQSLIDAINPQGDPLSTNMDRYLFSACMVVLLDNNASFKDVIRSLTSAEYRRECLKNIKLSIAKELIDEIEALKELDNYDKEGNLDGTKITKIDGILHRVNLLKKDLRLKEMFNKSCENNVDLVKAMDDGMIVIIKMPEHIFSTDYTKNIITTYWFTKIWSSMLIRGQFDSQPKRFHVIVDEIFKAKTAMYMLSNQEILPQTRKFGCKFVFSCQHFKQIDLISDTLRSAGSSYMFLKGCEKSDFKEFESELSPFTYDDMLAIPQFWSLNLINFEDGKKSFMTALPKPL